MIELTAEVTSKSDHAEIRIGGYLSSNSADRLDEAMQQVGDAKKVILIFDEKCFINSMGLSGCSSMSSQRLSRARSIVSSILHHTSERCSILWD